MENNSNGIKDFLRESYLSLSRDVINDRLRDIEISINDHNSLINDYQEQIDNLPDDIFNYPEYISMLNEYKELLRQINEDYNESVLLLDKQKQVLNDKYLILSKMVGAYYNNIVLKMQNNTNYLSICSYLDEVKRVLNNKIYLIAIDTRPIRLEIDHLEKEVNEKLAIKEQKEQNFSTESLQNTNILMSSIKSKLNNKIQKSKNQIEIYQKSKKEIENTLNDIVKKDIRNIERIVNERTFELKTRGEIIEEVNIIIEQNIERLKVQKSYEQIIKEKNDKKEELQSLLSSLKPQYDEYVYNLAILSEYQKNYDQALNNINQLKEFIDKSDMLINQSPNYYKSYQLYNHYVSETLRLKNALDEVDQLINQALRERNNISYKSNNEQELIDNKNYLNNLEKEKDDIIKQTKENKENRSTFEQNLSNANLIKIINKRAWIRSEYDDITTKFEKLDYSIKEKQIILDNLNEGYIKYLETIELLKQFD